MQNSALSLSSDPGSLLVKKGNNNYYPLNERIHLNKLSLVKNTCIWRGN